MHHSKAGWRKATPAQPTISEEQRILDTLDNIRHRFHTQDDREQEMAMDLAVVTDQLERLFVDEKMMADPSHKTETL